MNKRGGPPSTKVVDIVAMASRRASSSAAAKPRPSRKS